MSQTAELIKDMTIEDMPTEDLKSIADLCGVETALQILETFSGCNIYIPTKGYKLLIHKYVRQNYDGTTRCIKDFARRFSLSEKAIYNILNTEPMKRSKKGK